MSENVTPEQWARYIARDLGADFLPTQIGDSLSSTKRKADAYDALGPNPEAAVKGAREAMQQAYDAMAKVKIKLEPTAPEWQEPLIAAFSAIRAALAALGGGE